MPTPTQQTGPSRPDPTPGRVPFVVTVQSAAPVSFRLPAQMHPLGIEGEFGYEEMRQYRAATAGSETPVAGSGLIEDLLKFTGTEVDLLGD